MEEKIQKKAMSDDRRIKLKRRIAALREEMHHANNDLEYESYLNTVRELESLLKVH